MPSTSKKQHNFMEMVAHDPKKAKQLGIKQSVGKEFVAADKSKKFKEGGATRPDLQKTNVKKTDHGNMKLFKEGGKTMASKLFKGKETFSEELKEAKAIKSGKITPVQYARGEESEKEVKVKMCRGGGIETKGKTKGRMV
jgi:hypothetical protein